MSDLPEANLKPVHFSHLTPENKMTVGLGYYFFDTFA
jgi:hypothetical protein